MGGAPMSHHEVLFPPKVWVGMRGGPGYKTRVVPTDSATDARETGWDANTSRIQWDLALTKMAPADFAAVLNCYMCMCGAAHSFRYWDPEDWSTSIFHNTGFSATPANPLERGQCTPVGPAGGPYQEWLLQKVYYNLSGTLSESYSRRITKPMRPGDANYGIAVFAGGGLIFAGFIGPPAVEFNVHPTIRFAVDYEEGRLLCNTPIPVPLALQIEASFTFHAACIFDQTTDRGLQAAMAGPNQTSVHGVRLTEVTKYANEGSEEPFFGGFSAITAPIPPLAIDHNNGFYQRLSGGSGTQDVWLPNEAGVARRVLGGPYFRIDNAGSGVTYNIRPNGGGTTLVSIPVGQSATFYWLGSNAWRVG